MKFIKFMGQKWLPSCSRCGHKNITPRFTGGLRGAGEETRTLDLQHGKGDRV
jgi:hypothetical protein